MRITSFIVKIFFLSIFITLGGCEPDAEEDTCLKTKWMLVKEYEIKLAVHVTDANPLLSGGSLGSQKPADFEKMQVSGTIEKIECSDSTSGPVNLGNSYITKGIDYPAPIDVPKAYWIGHVVYVYVFDNDEDYLTLNMTVKITMKDDQSYTCNVSKKIYYEQIEIVPGAMYYYILLDIYSDLWVKV
jgi:hypothetical protein